MFLTYEIFDFVTDKTNNLDLDKATKRTALPIVKFNGYAANKVLAKVEKLVRRKIRYRFAELKFKSKFNCDPDTDIYEPGSIFKKLDKYYESRPDGFKYESPTV